MSLVILVFEELLGHFAFDIGVAEPSGRSRRSEASNSASRRSKIPARLGLRGCAESLVSRQLFGLDADAPPLVIPRRLNGIISVQCELEAVARYDRVCDASKTTTSAYRPKALSTAGLLRIARGRWW